MTVSLWFYCYRTQVRFCFFALSVIISVCLFFCLSLKCLGNGWTAKFTRRMCLVPCLDEFECQGQGHQGQKMSCALMSPPAAYEWYALAATIVKQQRTWPFHRCRGVISGACMWFMFCKTSLALGFVARTIERWSASCWHGLLQRTQHIIISLACFCLSDTSLLLLPHFHSLVYFWKEVVQRLPST